MNSLMKPDGAVAPLLLNSRQAARMIGVAERTLWDLRADGKIEFVRIGKLVRYRISDIEIYVAGLGHGE